MSGTTYIWQAPAGAEHLIGPGSPFEVVTEDVLGVPVRVFANRMRSMREVLAMTRERFGPLPNLVFPDLTLTYDDLSASVARVAAFFAERGVGKGDRVAIASANTAQFYVAWWATVVSGAIVSSLNGWWTPSEMRHGVDLSGPALVLADQPRYERLVEAGVVADHEVHDLRVLDPLLGPARADDPALPTAPIDEDDAALLLFTSGTTGRPKAATLSHRNLISFPQCVLLQGAIGATLAPPPPQPADAAPPPQPSSIQAGPLFHVSGVAPLVTGAFTGSRIVFAPVGAWSETTHLALTAEHRVAGWSLVPTQFWRLFEHPDFEKYDTSSVMQMGGGGATYSPELIKLMGRKVPQARIGIGYGMSETLGCGTRIGGITLETHPASVGTVDCLHELEIRDESGAVVADGEVGEICLRGAAVFLGYWDNPEASAKALDERRWYRTGDFGRVVDGVLLLESRMRDLIIRGGENIYPIEIENRLEEHPDVLEVAVIGVPHHQLGQEVAAVVVARPGSMLLADEVRAWVGAELAKFKIPAHVVFREELPHNASGKVVKHELEVDVIAELDAN